MGHYAPVGGKGGGGASPSNGLLGKCRWMGMGSPFQAFSIESLEWGCTSRL